MLTERTEHLNSIVAALNGKVPALTVLHGRLAKKLRATLSAQLEALPSDAPRVLLATGKLVGEGFDPFAARYPGAGNACVVERDAAAIRRSTAP